MENNKVIKDLREQIDEMSGFITDQTEELRNAEYELRYLKDFVSYHRLNDAYQYFKEHAHEEESDLPFPSLVL